MKMEEPEINHPAPEDVAFGIKDFKLKPPLEILEAVEKAPSKSEYTPSIEEVMGDGRSLAHYADVLHFKPEDLEGKVVLDLGASIKNVFAEQLKATGVKARVIALSPEYSDPEIYTIAEKASPEGELVSGLGQDLPFEDNFFDFEFALHVYEHIESKEIFYSMIKEMARTIKPGGIAKIGPVVEIPSRPLFKMVIEDEKLISDLVMLGTSIASEDDPEDAPIGKAKDKHGNSFYVHAYCFVIKKEKPKTESENMW